MNAKSVTGARADAPIFLCSAFSTTAGWINRTAVPLAVYGLTGSAVDTSFAFAAAYLPAITVGWFAGTIVDGNRPEVVIKATAGLSSVCIMLIALLLATWPWLPAVYVLLFLNSSMSAIQLPAFHALVLEHFSTGRLMEINSKLGMIDQTNSVLTPVAVGAAFALLPHGTIFFLSAGSYLGSALILTLVASSRPKALIRSPTRFAGVKDGFSCLSRDPNLLSATTMLFFANFATAVITFSLIPTLSFEFGTTSTSIGLFMAVLGIFGLFGHALARLSQGVRHLSSPMILLSSAAAVLTVVPALDPTVVRLALFWGVSVMLGAINATLYSTYRQQNVPSEMIGRVVAASRAVTYLPIPLAASISGFLFERFGSRGLLLTSSSSRIIGVILACAIMARLSKRDFFVKWLVAFQHPLRAIYWKLFRPNTFGVKVAIYCSTGNKIVLVQHRYGSTMLMLPGGAIGKGEAKEAAAIREIREELGIELAAVTLRHTFVSEIEGKRDTVYLFSAETKDEPVPDSSEILVAAFFPISELPSNTSPATRRRLGELAEERFSDIW